MNASKKSETSTHPLEMKTFDIEHFQNKISRKRYTAPILLLLELNNVNGGLTIHVHENSSGLLTS